MDLVLVLECLVKTMVVCSSLLVLVLSHSLFFLGWVMYCLFSNLKHLSLRWKSQFRLGYIFISNFSMYNKQIIWSKWRMSIVFYILVIFLQHFTIMMVSLSILKNWWHSGICIYWKLFLRQLSWPFILQSLLKTIV